MLDLTRKMKISNDSFGANGKFGVGDVVCWTIIGSKLTGVISQFREAQVGGVKCFMLMFIVLRTEQIAKF